MLDTTGYLLVSRMEEAFEYELSFIATKINYT